jgi:SAM-dependent MidA family methyltransferase
LSALFRLIADEIRRSGPMRFDRFMELTLYHPELGYYRRGGRDPFGRSGDFYTASQLQPVFGRVAARAIEEFRETLGSPQGFTVVEPGAGRAEMEPALRPFHYVPVEYGTELPTGVTGVIFSNEFFDALPVRALDRDGNRWCERLVTVDGTSLVFTPGPDYGPADPDDARESMELHEASLDWMRRIARSLERGYVLTIDYGYTAREVVRFPRGTLMSYRSHRAFEEVLQNPGEQDITSHVPFDLLRAEGERAGLRTEYFETLSQFLLRLGERDRFAEFVAGGEELHLKTLLYGMGETFRVLVQSKNVEHQ